MTLWDCESPCMDLCDAEGCYKGWALPEGASIDRMDYKERIFWNACVMIGERHSRARSFDSFIEAYDWIYEQDARRYD